MLRLSRGYLLALLYCMLFSLKSFSYFKDDMKKGKPITRRSLYQLLQGTRNDIAFFSRRFRRIFLNKSFILYRYISLPHEIYPFGTALDMAVGTAWLCEKMKVNMKIPNCTIWRFFENNTIINITDQSLEQRFEYNKRKFPALIFLVRHAKHSISSEYGHKVLSKLSIKEGLKKSANEWFDKHIKGDWVAVHYRGTDIAAGKDGRYEYRYRIELDSYITYLESVLDEQSSIFACSDQAQFIDKMQEAFPGRVYARTIKRSYDNKKLHVWNGTTSNLQQEREALLDLLILAKAELIYTTGSGFVDVVRYFNPQVKIVSLCGTAVEGGKNHIPIPRRDLFNRLSIPLPL